MLVNGDGNKTYFYLGPKSRLNAAELEILASCHHGAMNDDYPLYLEVMKMLKTKMREVDEVFYGKDDVTPVQIGCFISDVYQMHFGGFDNTEGASGSEVE